MIDAVAIATMTRARNAEDERLLAESIDALRAIGPPVFVADAGSAADFLAAIARHPNVDARREGSNLVAQVKRALGRAAESGAELVVYTEPDKREFFRRGLGAFLDAALEYEDAAIVIAARDAASLETFPAGQRRIESMFNDLAAQFLGPLPDLLYGPLALRPKLAMPYVEAADEALGWGWRPYVLARALRDGRSVAAHEAYYACPQEQRGEDDAPSRLYRLQQLADNVAGLYRGLSHAS